MTRRSIAVDVIADSLVHTEVSDDLNIWINIGWMCCIVGRGLGTTLSSLETPPISPRSSQIEPESNEELTNTNNGYSSNSSQSRASPDDESRLSNSQMNSVTYIGGVTTKQTISTPPRSATNSITNGTAFKMISLAGNICPRCSKAVYSAEEVKAAGKVITSHFYLHFHIFHSSSPFTNDVTLVLIVTKVSMLLDIPNTKENFMTTVSSTSYIDAVLLDR